MSAHSASTKRTPRPLRFTAAAVKGMGARAYQEDTCVILTRRKATLAVVADGMGGMQDGRKASRAAVSIISSAFERWDGRSSAVTLLRDALSKANDALYAELRGEGGTTVVACLFRESGMYYAGMGDSFLLLKRGDTLYRLNLRQNVYYALCAEQIRSGSVDRAPAAGHPERNALVGYLGMKELRDMDIYLRPLPLMKGDVLLLCSDGIGDVLSDEVLLDCLSSSGPEEACRRIDESVYESAGRYQDNYTAIAVRCE